MEGLNKYKKNVKNWEKIEKAFTRLENGNYIMYQSDMFNIKSIREEINQEILLIKKKINIKTEEYSKLWIGDSTLYKNLEKLKKNNRKLSVLRNEYVKSSNVKRTLSEEKHKYGLQKITVAEINIEDALSEIRVNYSKIIDGHRYGCGCHWEIFENLLETAELICDGFEHRRNQKNINKFINSFKNKFIRHQLCPIGVNNLIHAYTGNMNEYI